MAEQDSKPTADEPAHRPDAASPKNTSLSRRLLPLGLGIISLLVGCFWWGSQPVKPTSTDALSTPTVETTQAGRSPQANAALTRIASSLAQAQESLPTVTPTPANTDRDSNSDTGSAVVPLPTLTPTLVPSPVATRTVELSGDATLRLALNNDTFASRGQPVTIELDPRSYVLGGDTMTQHDQWCTQVGPAGLVFDVTYALQPNSENLYVNGNLDLYDGFCGEWGSLGSVLVSTPLNVMVPVGTSAIIAPSLQFQGSLMGIPNVLDISTGVFLEVSIRNPSPR